MAFIEIKINCTESIAELLIAELVEINFDSFQEVDEGILAYVEEQFFDTSKIDAIINKYKTFETILYSFNTLEEKNWNEEWEKNFQPVIIGKDCIVRASFHQPETTYKYVIVINPKMSFGTGHHETTSMMVEHQLEIDHNGKTIIDAGSGTGILAILASKLGASIVDAFDIEDWAFENLKENTILNDCLNIRVSQGTISSVSLLEKTYDLILANINRNILLEEMKEYSNRLNKNGKLVLSGFYKEDVALIENSANNYNLSRSNYKENNNWASLVFIKN